MKQMTDFYKIKYLKTWTHQIAIRKQLDGATLLVADPPCVNSTTKQNPPILTTTPYIAFPNPEI